MKHDRQTDAESLLSPPAPRQPERLQFATWRDVYSPVNSDEVPWKIQYTGEVHAIGFHGSVFPGMVAVVAPSARLTELVTWAAGAGGEPHYRFWQILADVPEWAAVMKPGDVIAFPGSTLKQGFSAVIVSPWHAQQYNKYRGAKDLAGVVFSPASTVSSYVEAITNRFGRAPQAVFRVWSTDDVVPVSLPYDKVPSFQWRLPLSSAPTYNATNNVTPDDVLNDFVLIGDAVTHVTLTVCQYSGAVPFVLSRVSAARDMNVYWLTSDGMWHYHPDDQWDSGGRGQVSATHDIEVYSVPRNVIGIAVKDATANTIVGVACTDAT